MSRSFDRSINSPCAQPGLATGRAGARSDQRRRVAGRRFASLAVGGALVLAAAPSGLAASAAADPAAAAAKTTAEPTIELTVLVLDDGSPTVGAIADRLEDEGVATRRLALGDPSRARITAEFLADHEAGIAHYLGVVAPSAALTGLDEDEKSTLASYQAEFGVREVDAYNWAHPGVGTGYPTYSGPVDGLEATLTSDALGGDWSYLDGQVDLDDFDPAVSESYGYLADPLPATDDSSFTPVLTATGSDGRSGTLMGVHEVGGRERLILTFASNGYQSHFKVLSHGIVSWLTQGVSTSLYRNIFSVHIDDVFLSNGEWNAEGNCTPGDECDPARYPDTAPGATSRMDASDVSHLVDWQRANDLKLDMTFNAAGARRGDALTTSLLANAGEMRWLNHTWEHPYIGCFKDESVTPWQCQSDPVTGQVKWYPEGDISREINRNIRWAQRNGVALDRTELVTGEHSGLKSLPQMPADNPNLAGALNQTGISWIASDASREAEQRSIGKALTVPRHPMNIYYNTSLTSTAVDEYNWVYTSAADGGSGICETDRRSTCIEPLDVSSGFADYIVPIETRIALGHLLGMDPRPHYAHQSNLTGDRILYPVLDGVLGTYRDLFADSAPVVNSSHAESGEELRRRDQWESSKSQVEASVTGDMLTVTNTGSAALWVPVTAPSSATNAGQPFGTSYAGSRSSWVELGAGESVTVDLGRDAGLGDPAPEAELPTSDDPAQLPEVSEPPVDAQDATVEIAEDNEATSAVTDHGHGAHQPR